MDNDMMNKNKNISLFETGKICSLMIIGLYLFMYIYVFRIWNTYKSVSVWKNIDFSGNVRNTILFIGVAFMLAGISYAILSGKNKKLKWIFTIALSILQIGIFIFSGMNVATTDLSITKNYFTENGVEYCYNVIYGYGIITFFLIVLIVVSICSLIMVSKSGLPEVVEVSKEKQKKLVGILRGVNYVVTISVIILYVVLSVCNSDILRSEEVVNIESIIRYFIPKLVGELSKGISAMVLPFVLFLIVIVNRCIKREMYLSVIGLYVVFAKAIKHIMYHAYRYVFAWYGYSYWDIDGKYFAGIKVAIGIFIIAALWKYLVQNIIKKEDAKKIVKDSIPLIVACIVVMLSMLFQNKELQLGTYYNSVKDSWVVISEDGNCLYTISPARGYNPEGIYIVKEDMLILDAGNEEYRFRIKDNKLVIEEYDGIADYGIELGTEFEWEGL